jgi:hypothetical protein
MQMRTINIFSKVIVSVGLLLMANACKPDPIPIAKGTLTLHFKPVINGTDLIPQSVIYTNIAQHVRFKIDMLQFYICDLIVKRADDSVISFTGANHVGLIKVMDIISKDVSFTLPEGEYKEIGFTLGLNSALNSTQPGDYSTNHPLGTDNGNYWIMNSSYVFTKLEGVVDTTSAGTGAFTRSFLYHLGTNDFASSANFTKSFTIAKDQTNTINVNMDVLTMFNGAFPIDMRSEVTTNTTDNLPLAQKFKNNFIQSIGIP